MDDIWLHIARESGSIDIANSVTDNVTDRFWLLAKHPFIGRKRDDLAVGLRSFSAGDYIILRRIEDDGTVLIKGVCSVGRTRRHGN